jgi:hypothetical protein
MRARRKYLADVDGLGERAETLAGETTGLGVAEDEEELAVGDLVVQILIDLLDHRYIRPRTRTRTTAHDMSLECVASPVVATTNNKERERTLQCEMGLRRLELLHEVLQFGQVQKARTCE